MAPSVALDQGHTSCPACVASCWWGASCPYLRRRCCLFRHSSEEVAAVSSVGLDSDWQPKFSARLADLEEMIRPVQERIAKEIIDVLAVIQEDIVEAVGATPVLSLDRVVGVSVATQTQVTLSPSKVPAPQTMEEILKVSQLTPQERTPERIVDETDFPVPRVKEGIIEAEKYVPQERIVYETDVPVPQVTEETIEDDQFQECFVAESEVPVPRVMAYRAEEIFQAVKHVPVDVPDPQLDETTVEVPQVHFLDRMEDAPDVAQTPRLSTPRLQERIFEETDAPVPHEAKKNHRRPQVQFLDPVENVPVVAQRQTPQERIADATDIPVPHVVKTTIEVVKHIPQERAQTDTAEQSADVPDPQIEKENDEVSQLIPQTPVDIPVPQIAEEFIEVFHGSSQNRAQQQIVEQKTETPAASLDEETTVPPKIQMQVRIVEKSDVPVPRVMAHLKEETTEVVQHVPLQQVHGSTEQQRVDVPDPQPDEENHEVTQLIPSMLKEQPRDPSSKRPLMYLFLRPRRKPPQL